MAEFYTSENMSMDLSMLGTGKMQRQEGKGKDVNKGKDNDRHRVSGDGTAASYMDFTLLGMLQQSDDSNTAVNLTKWMLSVTNRESHQNAFLVGAATRVSQRSLSDNLGSHPAELELN